MVCERTAFGSGNKNTVELDPDVMLSNSACDAPEVSWILCTNVADVFCAEAIRSCLNQTFPNFELIVVANGVDCEEVAESIKRLVANEPKVKVLTTAIHHLPFCLSLAVHHSRAPLIARMDADDISIPERLALQVAYMHEHPDVAVLGSTYHEIDAKGQLGKIVGLPESNEEVRKALPWKNPICHPSVMFRRAIVEQFGGYLGGLKAEDYDLWCRLSTNDRVMFANFRQPMLYYRQNLGGAARRSREAYITVAATQLRMLLATRRPIWLLAILMTLVKSMVRANKA